MNEVPNLFRAEHLLSILGRSTHLGDHELHTHVVEHAYSLLYAESERAIKDTLINALIRSAQKGELTDFIGLAVGRLLRSIKISEIAGFLGYIDGRCKIHFTESLSSQQQDSWNKILQRRHSVAHEKGINSVFYLDTPADLERDVQVAKETLSVIQKSLEITQDSQTSTPVDGFSHPN